MAEVRTDITTSGDGIETTPVNGLHSRLEVLLDDTVELEGLVVSTRALSVRCGTHLTGGQLEGRVSVLIRDVVHV